MRAKVGMYCYEKRGANWAVYIYTSVKDNSSTASKVCTFFTKEEASTYVYKMNGWNKH